MERWKNIEKFSLHNQYGQTRGPKSGSFRRRFDSTRLFRSLWYRPESSRVVRRYKRFSWTAGGGRRGLTRGERGSQVRVCGERGPFVHCDGAYKLLCARTSPKMWDYAPCMMPKPSIWQQSISTSSLAVPPSVRPARHAARRPDTPVSPSTPCVCPGIVLVQHPSAPHPPFDPAQGAPTPLGPQFRAPRPPPRCPPMVPSGGARRVSTGVPTPRVLPQTSG